MCTKVNRDDQVRDQLHTNQLVHAPRIPAFEASPTPPDVDERTAHLQRQRQLFNLDSLSLHVLYTFRSTWQQSIGEQSISML